MMHPFQCPNMDAESLFLIYLQMVILAKMEHHIRGRRAFLDRRVQALHGYVLHVLKLLLNRCEREVTELLHATDGAVAHKFWRYHV